jgi:hypothetical protein
MFAAYGGSASAQARPLQTTVAGAYRVELLHAGQPRFCYLARGAAAALLYRASAARAAVVRVVAAARRPVARCGGAAPVRRAARDTGVACRRRAAAGARLLLCSL